jgi:hypothetical protein
VIADLTENNPNVYYELCLRHAVGEPVIHMAHDGTLLSFDVRDNRTIFYTMHARSVDVAKGELADQIRKVSARAYKAANPNVETVGIIGLERSTDPDQKALGQVMEMVQHLGDEIKAIGSTIGQAEIERDEYPATYADTYHPGLSTLGNQLLGVGTLGGPFPTVRRRRRH